MKKIISNVIDFLNNYIAFPNFGLIDVIEILIIAFVIYHILVWIKNSRAWTLLKGILVILAFGIVAVLFNMSTILWIANKTLSVGVIAAIVIFISGIIEGIRIIEPRHQPFCSIFEHFAVIRFPVEIVFSNIIQICELRKLA